MDYQQNIIQNITFLMSKRHLSQAALAEKSDIDESSISQILKGRVNLGKNRLRKIAEALEVPITYLTQPFAENSVEEMTPIYTTTSKNAGGVSSVIIPKNVGEHTEFEKAERRANLLEKYADLKSKGIINEEEFLRFKKEIINL